MVTVIITYKLNEDVTREQYREWSRAVDQPMASRQPVAKRGSVQVLYGNKIEP